MFWKWNVGVIIEEQQETQWLELKKEGHSSRRWGHNGCQNKTMNGGHRQLWPWQTACACYTWPPLMLATKSTTHWNIATVSPIQASCMARFISKHLIAWSTYKNTTYMIPTEPEFPSWLYEGRENKQKVKIIRANYKKVIRNSSKRKWTNYFKVT